VPRLTSAPLRLAVALGLAAVAVSGCAEGRIASVPAAPHAADPGCAPAMIAMPDTVGDLALRPTDSQATAAWGDPAAVVLRCGVEPPGPTTDQCVSAEGVDWVVREEEGNWRITTYGRSPAVEVLFAQDRASSDSVMVSLAGAVSRIPAGRHCVNLQDATPVG
jgi:hypothetical protein